MLIKIISLALNKSETRVRIPSSLESDILEFAGVDKFANALPVLEQIIALEESINNELLNGSKFYETDSTGECYQVKWIYGEAPSKSNGESRVRITQELHDYILKRAGKETFSESLQYLQGCVNMANLIMIETQRGSTYTIKDVNGEIRKVGFIE